MEEIICFVDGENMDVLKAMGRIDSRECEQGSGALCFLEDLRNRIICNSFFHRSRLQSCSDRFRTPRNQSETQDFQEELYFSSLCVAVKSQGL